ncbi:MAG: 16S rRNA (uracil(1498)-N(3))-methyltransferase [Microthrixaceae bacterium]
MHPADHPGPMVYVADLASPELRDEDRHHLERVLRLRHGDAITLGDGEGGWRTAVLGRSLEPTGETEFELEPSIALTIAFALVKGDKPELIVQKLTEIGIDRIVPFAAARSVTRWDAPKATKAVERLRSVARAAAMQSHRARLPVVEDLSDFGSLTGRSGAALARRDGDPPSSAHRVVLIGPEGGWAPEEEASGLPGVALGSQVLRAETAAIAAGVLLVALRGGAIRATDAQVT